MKQKNLSILIVAFKPKINLLKSLILRYNDFYTIIIANNSEEKLNSIFYEFKNVKIIDANKNLGNGAGINLCLDECKTEYALYMDIDVTIDKINFLKLLNYSKKIKKFAVLVPNGHALKHENKIVQKWDIEGSIMMINIKNINNKVRFDENYFLYYEEKDFFLNCIKKNINVYFLPKVICVHQKASSIETINLIDSEKLFLLRQWHLMWSKYYFFKKNFNTFVALKKTFPLILKDLIKMIFYFLKFDFKLFKIRFSRISGSINSLLNLKSYKRLNKD